MCYSPVTRLYPRILIASPRRVDGGPRLDRVPLAVHFHLPGELHRATVERLHRDAAAVVRRVVALAVLDILPDLVARPSNRFLSSQTRTMPRDGADRVGAVRPGTPAAPECSRSLEGGCEATRSDPAGRTRTGLVGVPPSGDARGIRTHVFGFEGRKDSPNYPTSPRSCEPSPRIWLLGRARAVSRRRRARAPARRGTPRASSAPGPRGTSSRATSRGSGSAGAGTA
jgi:hypothetical protein